MHVGLLQPVEVFLPVIERQDPPGEDFQLADAKDIQAGICHPWREAEVGYSSGRCACHFLLPGIDIINDDYWQPY